MIEHVGISVEAPDGRFGKIQSIDTRIVPNLKGRLANTKTSLKSTSESEDVVSALYKGVSGMDAEEAFFVADLAVVRQRFEDWARLLPRVTPFYAVKCNPEIQILRLLARLGTGFDCASRAEMQMILDEGISPDRIVYAHPCKPGSHVRFAAENGVNLTVFDNEAELYKIQKLHPDARLLVRILADDSNAQCKLGLKYGAAMESVPRLLAVARALDLNVVGVSFHVGSGCSNPSAYEDAILCAYKVFQLAPQYGFSFNLLDMGGGFPGWNSPRCRFSDVASCISHALDMYFPPQTRVKIIAEPGRYFVASAFQLAVCVVAKRSVRENDKSEPHAPQGAITNAGAPSKHDNPAFMYYVNDGVYGSFNCTVFDHQPVFPEILLRNGKLLPRLPDEQKFETSIWGPSCDSIDCVVPKAFMPQLEIGDWILFKNMGAYTLCAASSFNGFEIPGVKYIDSQRGGIAHRPL